MVFFGSVTINVHLTVFSLELIVLGKLICVPGPLSFIFDSELIIFYSLLDDSSVSHLPTSVVTYEDNGNYNKLQN